jgi:DNA-binding transcriptional LysR family regulator
MLTEAGWRLVAWTDTLHRQVDKARTDARAGFRVSVEPLRVAAIHSLSLTVFSDWIAAICGRPALDPSSSLSKASPVASV